MPNELKSYHWLQQDEFQCPCCGRNETRQELIILLNTALLKLRERYPTVDLKVTSGYRCRHHNQEVGGSTNSYHLKGLAADVQVIPNGSGEWWEIVRWWVWALIQVGFTGIGQAGRGRFSIHSDLRHIEGRPPALWALAKNLKTGGTYTYWFPWGIR